jgi:malate dehydrogenase
VKISIIGAGNVGSALAERVLTANLCDVVLVDIAEGLARAKAFDLTDASPLAGYKKNVLGTNDYKDTRDSAVIVITAGFPRKPGMSREDLINKNGGIVRSVVKNVKELSPGAIFIVITNPLDIMTYLVYKEIGGLRRKVIGMAGNLDTSRFKALISQASGVPSDRIEAIVLGSHGDTMVPLISKTLIDGKPLREALSAEKVEALVKQTKKRGGEIVGLLKSGSAYFSPSAACLEILKAIINDEKKAISCSVVLEGEYGITGCAIGVPVSIGKDGIEKIIEWHLPGDEQRALMVSARAVKNVLDKL